MSSLKLTDTLWWNGALDPDTHISDVIVQMEFGTTYNSYTLKGSEKTALIETSKYKFWEAFKGELDDAVDITKVDYIIWITPSLITQELSRSCSRSILRSRLSAQVRRRAS